MTDARDELKAWSADIAAVSAALGLERARERGKWNCPACGSKDNLSLTAPAGTLRAHCFGNCGLTGDVFCLVAGANGLDVQRDFREVLKATAELAGRLDLLEESERPSGPRPVRRAEPKPVAPPVYAPEAEVATLWASARQVHVEDLATTAYLTSRGFDAAELARCDLLRVLPQKTPDYPWARFGSGTWAAKGYRMVVPVYDRYGEMRGLRAWTTSPNEFRPKRIAPKGVAVKGLVMANAPALAMLRGELAPDAVIVAEGEPDFLAAATRPVPYPVLGVEAGAWTPEVAARIPDGARVALWTHFDDTGDRYAAVVAATLRIRCTVLRAIHERKVAA